MPHRPYSPRSAAGRGGRSRVAYYGSSGVPIPAQIPTLVAWYDLSDSRVLWQDTSRTVAVASDADPIGGVTDKSTAGNHLSQSTTTKRPAYKTNILNGQAVGRFDGSDDHLVSATFGTAYAQPNTVVIVLQDSSLASAIYALLDGVSSTRNKVSVDNTVAAKYSLFAGSSVVGPAFSSGAQIAATYFNGASSKIYVNGGSSSAISPGTQALGKAVVGIDTGEAVQAWKGDIAELLVYNSALSVADLNKLGSYLGTKYGITWTTAT